VSFAPITLHEVRCGFPGALAAGTPNSQGLHPARNDYEPSSPEEEQPESEEESQQELPVPESALSVQVEERSSEEVEVNRLSTTSPKTMPVPKPALLLRVIADDERAEEEGAESGAESGDEPRAGCAATPVGNKVWGA
jgi:hypothetical protein